MKEKQILEIKDFAFKSPVDFISNLASFLFLVHAIQSPKRTSQL